MLGKRYNAEKKKHGGDRKSSRHNDDLKTSDKLADEYKVSPRTIERDGTFAQAVDALAVQGQQKALRTPQGDEEAPGIIWAEDLLPGPQNGDADACPCCGKIAWWTKITGQRVCGVCHPKPVIRAHRNPVTGDRDESATRLGNSQKIKYRFNRHRAERRFCNPMELSRSRPST